MGIERSIMARLFETLPRRLTRTALIAVLSIVVITLLFRPWQAIAAQRGSWLGAHTGAVSHPIDELIRIADVELRTLLQKQTTGVNDAAAAYRAARGRHPPPGWSQYVHWCEFHGVMMVEDFYDPLYRDLAPFWGVSPSKMREFPRHWHHIISIRNGSVERSEVGLVSPGTWQWVGLWQQAIEKLPLKDLPDVDLAFNRDDEPKLFPSYETLRRAQLKAEGEHRSPLSIPLSQIQSNSTSREAYNVKLQEETSTTAYKWSDLPKDSPIWELAQKICPPGSPGHQATLDVDYTRNVQPYLREAALANHLHQGFVRNWTLAKSACENPYLRGIHGSFVNMRSWSFDHVHEDGSLVEEQRSVIEELVPLLSGCKIHAINADIVVPPAVQMTQPVDDDIYLFHPKNQHAWKEKQKLVMWRGTDTGGAKDAVNWTRFHRARFIAMLNGTNVLEHFKHLLSRNVLPLNVPGGSPSLPHNLPIPDRIGSLSALSAVDPAEALSSWIASISPNSGFINMNNNCPGNHPFDPNCSYMEHWYSLLPHQPLSENFRYKYLPDVDGFTYSGRFKGFLQSHSLPIKATIYDEWHDGRLVPWKHFVPMDNSFIDWYGMMEYFIGYDVAKIEGKDAAKTGKSRNRKGHDNEAKNIAMEGSEWAAKVVRYEDQQAYLYRLILEMARLSDDRRLEMGWVEDLKEQEEKSKLKQEPVKQADTEKEVATKIQTPKMQSEAKTRTEEQKHVATNNQQSDHDQKSKLNQGQAMEPVPGTGQAKGQPTEDSPITTPSGARVAQETNERSAETMDKKSAQTLTQI